MHNMTADTIYALKVILRMIVFGGLGMLTIVCLVLMGVLLPMWQYYLGCVVATSFFAVALHSLYLLIFMDL